MKQPLKTPPQFTTEVEEQEFWNAHDSTDYVDWSQAHFTNFPNLKPSTSSISVRLPIHLLSGLKAASKSLDVPYQSLMKVWLMEKLQEYNQKNRLS